MHCVRAGVPAISLRAAANMAFGSVLYLLYLSRQLPGHSHVFKFGVSHTVPFLYHISTFIRE